jgi:3-hydroxybutyrate dehydrogenase
MKPLTGKRALVTGSTQGIGLAVSRRLASVGCDVVVHGLESPAVCAAQCRQIEEEFCVRTMYSTPDLRNSSATEQMIVATTETFGGIDILINNAVVRHVAPIESITPEQWEEDLAVNLSAPFHTIRLALPAMKTQNWGRIINVSSIYGLVGATNRAGYVATKTALLGLTRAVALETSGYDITCNAVCPGTSATPMHEASLMHLREQQGLERDVAERALLAGKQPTGRLIAPDGVAALIVTLCSPQSRDITGAAIPIDGGWSAM